MQWISKYYDILAIAFIALGLAQLHTIAIGAIAFGVGLILLKVIKSIPHY